MFDDFQAKSPGDGDSRKRMGGSMAAAVVLYGGLITLIVGGTTAATTTVVEHLTQVEFAPPPPPPPPPPPKPQAVATTEPLKNLRPKVKRKKLKPPTEVPKDKPQESDAELVPSEDTGPLDGFLDGVIGGTGTKAASAPPAPPPPPPKPPPLVPPVADKHNAQPRYSASAKRKEIEGVVVVVFDVLANGSVANAKIVSGPEELHDSVLKTVVHWRFRPATRGGHPVRTRLKRAIRFQLTDV